MTRGAIHPLFMSAPGNARFLWSPDAHKLFDEECYFYLISGEDSRGDRVLDRLQDIFDRIGITGATTHVVYGPIDALIRVWLTPSRRQALLRALQSSESELPLDSIMEFRTTQIDYHWSESAFCANTHTSVQPSESEESELKSKITELLVTLNSDLDSDERSEDFLDLQKSEHLSRLMSPSGIKFFMFFYRDEGREVSYEQTTKELCSIAAAATAQDVQAVSVYAGNGFCDFILKGVVSEYLSLLDKVQRIQDSMEPSLSGWTLVPADYGARPEGETIDAALQDTPERLLNRLGAQLEQEDREGLRVALEDNLVRSACDRYLEQLPGWLDERESARIDRILGTILARNKRRINRETSFLFSVEPDLRTILAQNAYFVFTDDQSWLSPEHHSEFYPENVESLLNDLNLTKLFELLASQSAADASVRETISSFIASDWVDLFETVVQQREAVEHGRVLASALKGTPDWNWLLTLPIQVRFQIGLERLIDDTNATLLHEQL